MRHKSSPWAHGGKPKSNKINSNTRNNVDISNGEVEHIEDQQSDENVYIDQFTSGIFDGDTSMIVQNPQHSESLRLISLQLRITELIKPTFYSKPNEEGQNPNAVGIRGRRVCRQRNQTLQEEEEEEV